MATTAARSEPTASITATTSSICSSSVGAPEIRSDRPAPRLSKVINLENEVNRLSMRAAMGHSHMCSICQIQVGTQRMSTGPLPTTW